MDRKVNKLSSPWSMLAFSWLISHADVEGRTYGDAELVKSIVFPRQSSITTEMMEEFIQEWIKAGLVTRYVVEDELYIEFPNFGKHQVGLRKDKEPKSIIPPNPDNPIPQPSDNLTENIRQTSGQNQAEVKVEVKLREVEEEVEDVPAAIAPGDVDAHKNVKSGWIKQGVISSFEQVSGLTAPINQSKIMDKWFEALERLEKAGVTLEIMRQACQEMTEKKYKITGPWSIERPCGMILAERKRETVPRDRKRDSAGKFAEYINH